MTSLQATMNPLSRAASSVAKRGRALTPAIRAYKADPAKHHHEEAAKKSPAAEQHQLEKKGAAAEPSAAVAPRQPPARSSMMMAPLLGSSALGAFFPPSAVSMLRQMDSMFANDPFFARASSVFENDPFFAPARSAAPSSSGALAAAAPAAASPPQLLPLDISETDDAYMIKADLPGVEKSDVKVVVSPDGQFLTISGERAEEKRFGGEEAAAAPEGGAEGSADDQAAAPQQQQQSRPLRVERRWSSWSRSLALSPDVDVEGVKASLKDGVLQVQLPKVKPAEEEEAAPAPKTIAVE